MSEIKNAPSFEGAFAVAFRRRCGMRRLVRGAGAALRRAAEAAQQLLEVEALVAEARERIARPRAGLEVQIAGRGQAGRERQLGDDAFERAFLVELLGGHRIELLEQVGLERTRVHADDLVEVEQHGLAVDREPDDAQRALAALDRLGHHLGDARRLDRTRRHDAPVVSDDERLLADVEAIERLRERRRQQLLDLVEVGEELLDVLHHLELRLEAVLAGLAAGAVAGPAVAGPDLELVRRVFDGAAEAVVELHHAAQMHRHGARGGVVLEVDVLGRLGRPHEPAVDLEGGLDAGEQRGAVGTGLGLDH